MNNLNNRILEVWKNNLLQTENTYIPLFYREIHKHSLLFVGLNPSFNPLKWQNYLTSMPDSGIVVEEFFKFDPNKRVEIEKVLDIEEAILDKHTYFKRIEEISEEIFEKYAKNKRWAHLDLFFFRLTKQELLKSIIYTDKQLNKFANDQLEISLELIQESEPAIIIVINALACKIIRERWGSQIIYNDERGYDEITLRGKVVPIFFSGMLSGQRALDNETFKRLKWHIGKAVQLIN